MLRYRIELYTDEELRWFAEVQSVDEEGHVVGWTVTSDLWDSAVLLAIEKIREFRK